MLERRGKWNTLLAATLYSENQEAMYVRTCICVRSVQLTIATLSHRLWDIFPKGYTIIYVHYVICTLLYMYTIIYLHYYLSTLL